MTYRVKFISFRLGRESLQGEIDLEDWELEGYKRDAPETLKSFARDGERNLINRNRE